MAQTTSQPDRRVTHGAVFVLLMACGSMVPALRGWPWIWLAPFLAYFAIIACIPALRRSLDWLRVGKFSTGSIAATFGVIALTVPTLLLFQAGAHPDVRGLRSALPFGAYTDTLAAGALFTVVNATLEEMVFRGILFDSLEARWGAWVTLAVTTVLFGLGHLHGYPLGPAGACLAALFGLAMGLLRLRTGGLALPIVAHLVADATIYSILVHSGSFWFIPIPLS